MNEWNLVAGVADPAGFKIRMQDCRGQRPRLQLRSGTLKGIRQWCDRNETLLIADEVLT